MNTLTGTTSFNTVADNIGEAIIDNSDYTSEQVFYNFEVFDHTKFDTTFYIYPADVSRDTLLKDLYKNIVEWHITVVYKEEKNDVLDESTYDLRTDLVAAVQAIHAAIAADISFDGTCRVSEIIGVYYEGTQSPGEQLVVARIFLSTTFYTDN